VNVFAKIAPDFSIFDCGGAFTSWLEVFPDNQVSGGKVLSSETRQVNNRATALLLAGQSLPPVAMVRRQARQLGFELTRRSQASCATEVQFLYLLGGVAGIVVGFSNSLSKRWFARMSQTHK
jgi:hypothetical protein